MTKNNRIIIEDNKYQSITCKICGKTISSSIMLSRHLKSHKPLTSQEYYKKFYTCKTENFNIIDNNSYDLLVNLSKEEFRYISKVEGSSIKKIHKKTMNKIIGNFPTKCKICGKTITKNYIFTNHIMRVHSLTIEEYAKKYFSNKSNNFKIEKCGFCNNDALPNLVLDIDNEEYYKNYDDGYFCHSQECKNSICLEFFGVPFKDNNGAYEHIGAKVEYLSKLYKRPIKEICTYKKSNPNRIYDEKSKSNLNGYILRYGEENGRKKYNERCTKIGNSNKVEWYIEHYGIEEGQKKHEEYKNKLYEVTKDIRHSKYQFKIFESLNENDKNWQAERYCAGCAMVDMINWEKHIVIEYYGDYWHCNPEIYNDDFFNKNLHMKAKEKQEKDNKKLNKILNCRNYTNKEKYIDKIIVIWEKSYHTIGHENILKIINDIIDNNKKGITWI